MPERQYKQLTIKDREQIEDGLNASNTAAKIARNIEVSVSCVTREIKRNRRDDGYRTHTNRNYGNANICAKKAQCEITKLCRPCNTKGTKFCSKCKTSICAKRCLDFTEEVCLRTIRFPFVCNGCGSLSGCRLHRFRYSARDAQAMRDARSYDARCGLDVTEQEMANTVAVIKAGLKNNQGLAHIYASHEVKMAFSLRSCYRHIKNGDIPITPMNLPKQLRYKPRDKKRGSVRETMPKAVLSGRRYSDFLALDEQMRANVVEMDCVVGPLGTKDAILTLHFKALHFQIGIKLVRKDTANVVASLDALNATLGDNDFRRLFGLILCDRGCEFYDVFGMERKDEDKRCSVYFMIPRAQTKKGHVRKIM